MPRNMPLLIVVLLVLLTLTAPVFARSSFYNPSDALVSMKASYDAAKAAHVAAEKALVSARDTEKKARSAYFQALNADRKIDALAKKKRDDANAELQRLNDAADRLRLSDAQVTKSQKITKRQSEITAILSALGNAQTQQSRDLRAEFSQLSKEFGEIQAEGKRLAAKRKAMQPDIRAAEDRLRQAEAALTKSLARPLDQLAERTAWLTAELTRKKAQKTESETRRDYIAKLKAYRRLFALNPPRHLRTVKITVEGRTYYSATYDEIETPEAPMTSGVQLEYATTLDDALIQVQKELKPLREVMAQRDKEREEIVLRLPEIVTRIQDTAEKLRSAKIDAVLAPMAIEIGATVAEFVATGGVLTGARILTEKVAERLTEGAIRQSSKVITARIASKKLGDVVGAGIGKGGAFAIMDKRGADLTAKLKLGTFEAVVLSDVIELGLTETVPAMRGLHKLYSQPMTKTWSSVSSGAKALRGNLSFAKAAGSVKPGVPIAIVGTLTKAAVAEYYAQKVSALEAQFYADIAESGALIAMFDHYNQLDRALIDLLTMYEAAEQDIFFRLMLADEAIKLDLNRSTDDVYEYPLGTKPGVSIDLTFSGPLTLPPKVSLHGIEATVSAKPGTKGRSWTAKVELPEKIGKDVKELELSVSLSPKEKSWTALDSVPETQLIPTVPKEDWRGYEAAPDTRHRLKLEPSLPDFSGRWHNSGGEYGDVMSRLYVFRIVQTKNRLQMFYDDIPDRVLSLCRQPTNRTITCLEHGQVFFDVELADDPETEYMIEYKGKAYLRRRQGKCGVAEEASDVTVYGAPTGDIIRFEYKLIENRGDNLSCNYLRTDRLVNSMFHRLGTPAAQENLRLNRSANAIFLGELSFYSPGISPPTIGGGGGERVAYPNDSSGDFFLPLSVIGEAPNGFPVPIPTPSEKRRLLGYQEGKIKNVPGFFPASPATYWKDLGIDPPEGMAFPSTGSGGTPPAAMLPDIKPLEPVQPFAPVEPPKPFEVSE